MSDTCDRRARVLWPPERGGGRGSNAVRAVGTVSLGLALIIGAPANAAFGQVVRPEEGRLLATDAGSFATNAVLGAVSGGVAALVRGESALDGFVRGFAGGTSVYLGKRLATERFPGSGFLGRQLASVGSGAVGNLVAGRGFLDRVAFGVGPLRVWLDAHTGRVRWRIDAPAAIAAAWAVGSGDYAFEPVQSVATGAAVFRARSWDAPSEFSAPGTIFWSPSSTEREGYVLAHESVHVLQYDQVALFWSDPAEDALLGGWGPTRWLNEQVELNLVAIAIGMYGASRWEHNDLPWEVEAMGMARR